MNYTRNLHSRTSDLPTGTSVSKGQNQRLKRGKVSLITLIALAAFMFMPQFINAKAITPDWSVTLNTEKVFSSFTVFDNNNDGSTWLFYTDGEGVSSACYVYNTNNDADDWLVTPALTLKAGTHYKVSFHARANSDYYKENMEVKAATTCTAASLASGTVIMPNTQLGKENKLLEYSFTPTKDGDYYIGFHAVTPANANRLFLYDVSVKVGAADNAPAAVENLTITPNAAGDLAATLQFRAPNKKVDGSKLEKLDSIVIQRNGEKIATLTGIAPGSSQTYNDSNVKSNGDNTYAVTAFAGGMSSDAASATEYIGVVAPTRPKTFTITDQTSSVLAK